jgi:hypothetical protein
MNKRITSLLVFIALAAGTAPSLRAAVPEIVHYQGQVSVSGTPFNGIGKFKFAFVDGAGTTTFWSNDGTSVGGAPTAADVSIAVSDGLYSVLLGDVSLPNMTQPVGASLFADHSGVYLRVWFDDGVNGSRLLEPDVRITSVGYAMVAAKVADGGITDAAFKPNITLGGANTSGTLTLKAGGDQTRAVLDAGLQNVSPSLRLFDPTGTFDTARLVGSEFLTGGAQLMLKNGAGNTTLEFDAQDGSSTNAGGYIRLKKNDGKTVVALNSDIENGNSGLLLYDAAGSRETVRLTGSLLGTKGGFLSLKNATGSPTIQFDAQIDGADTNSGGMLLLGNGGFEKAAELTGDGGEKQGKLTLRRSNRQEQVILDADGANDGAELKLFDSDGSQTIGLRAAQSLQAGGTITVGNAQGDVTAELTGDGGESQGKLVLKANDLKTRVSIDADGINNGAQLGLHDSDGTQTILLTGAQGMTKGGSVDIKDSDGTSTITLDGDDVDEGGRIELRRGSGQRTVALSADLNGDGKGALLLYKPDGITETVRITGSLFGTGGGYAHWADQSGNVTVKIQGDSNGEGKITTQVLQITGGADLSEQFEISTSADDLIAPGSIVCIDPKRSGELRVSDRAYDPTVAGIISGAGGVKPGMLMGQRGTPADGQHPVALTGRVYCKVDASHGAIKPGDFITTSPTPGHGMRADSARASGTILGKAMTPLGEGRGLVLVLVSLQ